MIKWLFCLFSSLAANYRWKIDVGKKERKKELIMQKRKVKRCSMPILWVCLFLPVLAGNANFHPHF
jgi:hypothetical protein